MRHFIIFLILVMTSSYLLFLKRTETLTTASADRVVRIFGYSSFTSQWGPGPELKKIFEKDCRCRVEFVEGSDSGILLQRLKMEGESLGADLVIGLDQFDLAQAEATISWRDFKIAANLEEEVQATAEIKGFTAYDWGVLTFIGREGDNLKIKSMNDLLDPNLQGLIALQDPRTSSPGLQFINWIFKIKGEDEGRKFILAMMKQVHSHSPSWSSSYGLFTNKQVKTVYSYVTSPLYHRIVEKDKGFKAFEFSEGHAMQVEFAGIPAFCKNCDLAENFLQLMMSNEGQKILMTKNFMFPVVKGLKEGTEFDTIPKFSISAPFEVPTHKSVEELIKKWTELRRAEGL